MILDNRSGAQVAVQVQLPIIHVAGIFCIVLPSCVHGSAPHSERGTSSWKHGCFKCQEGLACEQNCSCHSQSHCSPSCKPTFCSLIAVMTVMKDVSGASEILCVRKPCHQFQRLQVLQEFLTKQEGRKGQDVTTKELKGQRLSQKMPD